MNGWRFAGLVATPTAIIALAVLGVATAEIWYFIAAMVTAMFWWFLLEGDMSDYEKDMKRWLENQKKSKHDTDDQGWLGEE